VKTSRGYTLIEMLVAVTVFLIVSAAATKFITLAVEVVAMHQHRVETNRVLLDLQRAWQRGLADSDPTGWKSDGSLFDAGTSKFRVEEGKLNYEREGNSLPLYLPQGIRLQFSIEREPALPARAVLRCDWTSNWLKQHRTNSVRMVACGEEKR
jgi:prepilin-type N-terminal cleavage/methylation domain-containing protein